MYDVDVNDLVAYLDQMCVTVTNAWKTLQVLDSCNHVVTLLAWLVGATALTPDDCHVQRIKTDKDAVTEFHSCIGALVRVLVNLSFLYDSNKYPEHRR
jgi:hypothetical protein